MTDRTPKRTCRKGVRQLHPTGITPKRKKKKHHIFSQEPCHNGRWTRDEEKFLTHFVESRGVENIKYKDWKDCADQMNTAFQLNRTASSCMNAFTRKCRLNPPFKKTREMGVQTDATFGPLIEVTWACSSQALYTTHSHSLLRSMLSNVSVSEPASPVIRSQTCHVSDIPSTDATHNYSQPVTVSEPASPVIRSQTSHVSDIPSTDATHNYSQPVTVSEPASPVIRSQTCHVSDIPSTDATHNYSQPVTVSEPASPVIRLQTCHVSDIPSTDAIHNYSQPVTVSEPASPVIRTQTCHVSDIPSTDATHNYSQPVTVSEPASPVISSQTCHVSDISSTAAFPSVPEHNYSQPLTVVEPASPVDCCSIMLEHNYSNQKRTQFLSKKKIKRQKKMSQLAEFLSNPSRNDPARVSLTHLVKLKLLLNTRNPRIIARYFMNTPSLKDACIDLLADSVQGTPLLMTGRKYNASVLMKKDFESLKSFVIEDIVDEFRLKFPELFLMFQRVMLPKSKQNSAENQQDILPRLAMIYSVMLFTRNPELSRFQRVIASCLLDNICDQKVYDQMNKLGVTVSYCRALEVFKQVGGHFNDVLIDAVHSGKRIRLVGDNLNFSVDVNQERYGKHKHMVHMFASAALISEHYFMSKPGIPEIPLAHLTINNVLLSQAEYCLLRHRVVSIVAHTLSKYLPHLGFVKDSVPVTLAGPESHLFCDKTRVVPLTVLPYNEQYYQDTVKILDSYENIITDINQVACHQKQIQIGGDQLTRERFSGAMKLRLGNQDARNRFEHLSPTTFEFFHLGMNFLEKPIICVLWNEDGIAELGTLKCGVERTFRNSFDTNVMKAYDSDRDFILSYTRALIVEAGKQFFGMIDHNSYPTINIPPRFNNQQEQKDWEYETLGKPIDRFIFPCWTGNDEEPIETLSVGSEFVDIELSNGSVLHLPVGVYTETLKQHEPDKVNDYAHYDIETGTIFYLFLELIETPERDQLLALFKMMMMIMRRRNLFAKYPFEILRMLIQQYSLLPLREACQVLQSCFVNTKGQAD
ncbi:uncharacterized protein [Haliotis cracherodii]|uniref:uncharacterized protein n=1 Tax=Haliotis cracherodii TaxID=6455 RepID=UPI0039E73302